MHPLGAISAEGFSCERGISTILNFRVLIEFAAVESPGAQAPLAAPGLIFRTGGSDVWSSGRRAWNGRGLRQPASAHVR